MPLNPKCTVAELKELRTLTGDEHGAQRVAFTPMWVQTRAWLQAKLSGLPVETHTDAAGNFWATLRGESDQALLMGGHMDSVPNGGWLDGCLNVMAAVEVLRRINEQYKGKPPVTVRVVDWADEEGARFGKSLFGSSACSGALDMNEARGLKDKQGVTLPDALKQVGVDFEKVRDSGKELKNAAAYLELHIEQGPALVDVHKACGIVTAIRGNLRFKHAHVLGQYGHAGAVPRAARRDALFAASEFASRLESLWLEQERAGRDIVCTVGQFFTDSAVHTMTKIPGEVRFTMDIRSHDDAVLTDMQARLREIAADISQRRGVQVDIGEPIRANAAVMDTRLRAMLRQIASEQGIDAPDIASGAGHDCAVFSREGIPCAMIFVRNDHGSHNPDEAMEIADFGEACRLLFGLLDRLA